MERGYSAGNCAAGHVLRHLYEPAQGARRQPAAVKVALPHERVGDYGSGN